MLLDLYESWLRPRDSILVALKAAHKKGCPVQGAQQFREACTEVRSILSVPLDRALRALQNPAPGRTTAEIRDELRRKVEARG